MISKLANLVGYGLIRTGASLPARIHSLDEEARLIRLLEQQRIDCVLDVGAHHGWFGHKLRRAGYIGDIISFEPVPANAAQIEAKAAADPGWSVQRCALGEVAETKIFNVLSTSQGGTTMSSFLEPKIGFARREAVEVEVRRLEDVLDAVLPADSNPRLFLKVDTQGFDIPVFRGAGRWLDRVFAMQSEISVIPIYEGMTRYTDSLTVYQDMGFALIDLLVVNRTPDGRVLEFDCRMARPPVGQAGAKA